MLSRPGQPGPLEDTSPLENPRAQTTIWQKRYARPLTEPTWNPDRQLSSEAADQQYGPSSARDSHPRCPSYNVPCSPVSYPMAWPAELSVDSHGEKKTPDTLPTVHYRSDEPTRGGLHVTESSHEPTWQDAPRWTGAGGLASSSSLSGHGFDARQCRTDRQHGSIDVAGGPWSVWAREEMQLSRPGRLDVIQRGFADGAVPRYLTTFVEGEQAGRSRGRGEEEEELCAWPEVGWPGWDGVARTGCCSTLLELDGAAGHGLLTSEYLEPCAGSTDQGPKPRVVHPVDELLFLGLTSVGRRDRMLGRHTTSSRSRSGSGRGWNGRLSRRSGTGGPSEEGSDGSGVFGCGSGHDGACEGDDGAMADW